MIRVHEVFQPEEQISYSAFCQFAIEFLSGTLHESQALLVVNYTSSNKMQYISSCALMHVLYFCQVRNNGVDLK